MMNEKHKSINTIQFAANRLILIQIYLSVEAIKKTRIKRTGNQLTLTLPDTFKAEEVDVLIWASNEEASPPATNLSEDLLWSDMTDEELSFINEKRQHLNAWK